jgi:hypothetical protein
VRGSLNGSRAVAITLVWQGKRAFTSAIDGDGDIVTARWMRRPGFAWLRRWTIIERAAFLARRLCEGRCVGFGWNVVACVCVGVSVHGRALTASSAQYIILMEEGSRSG